MHCGELDLETQLVERKHRNEPPTENTTWEEGCKDKLLIILIYDFFLDQVIFLPNLHTIF